MSRADRGSILRRPTDTLEEFERLLHLGLGRAVLFLRAHDATPYREALVRACVHELRAAIYAQGSRALGAVVLDRWGRHADEHDLVNAATDLLAETDDDRLVSYLRIFRKRAFPLDPGPLLPLVRHPSRRVSAAAFTSHAVAHEPLHRRPHPRSLHPPLVQENVLVERHTPASGQGLPTSTLQGEQRVFELLWPLHVHGPLKSGTLRRHCSTSCCGPPQSRVVRRSSRVRALRCVGVRARVRVQQSGR